MLIAIDTHGFLWDGLFIIFDPMGLDFLLDQLSAVLAEIEWKVYFLVVPA